MIAHGPNVTKSRLDSTMLVVQQPLPEKFAYSSQIIPVEIISCTPNTGFLPVIQAATQYVGYNTDDPEIDDILASILVLEDGVYDCRFRMGQRVSDIASDVEYGLYSAATVLRIGSQISFGISPDTQEIQFAVWAKAGELFQITFNTDGVTSFVNGSLTVIPRSL